MDSKEFEALTKPKSISISSIKRYGSATIQLFRQKEYETPARSRHEAALHDDIEPKEAAKSGIIYRNIRVRRYLVTSAGIQPLTSDSVASADSFVPYPEEVEATGVSENNSGDLQDRVIDSRDASEIDKQLSLVQEQLSVNNSSKL